MKFKKSCGVAGRPRGFCVDDALDKALKVFWQKGYDGASLSDLTEAMGINRPSLYATYGNKEHLFIKALDRYVEVYGCFVAEALQKPKVREVVLGLLRGGLDSLSEQDRPKGCLGVQGALSCSDAAEVVKAELTRRRSVTQEMIAERFQRAKDEGEISEDADPHALALFISAVTYGMSVQATGGASREDLEQVANIALQAFEMGARTSCGWVNESEAL